jgi:Ca2+/Na+ antiporter
LTASISVILIHPYLVGVTWLATLFLARGRVGRIEGLLLATLYSVYVVLHIALS